MCLNLLRIKISFTDEFLWSITKQWRLVSLWITIELKWKIGVLLSHYLTSLILLSLLTAFICLSDWDFALSLCIWASGAITQFWSNKYVGDEGHLASSNFLTRCLLSREVTQNWYRWLGYKFSICRMSASAWNILPGECQMWALPTLTSPAQGACAGSVIQAGGSLQQREIKYPKEFYSAV